jgi:pimeloyl-ACP methyl ester carboxylesterase
MKIEGFEHRLVLAGDVHIHSVSGGSGTPLVLIHGFPQTWWVWHKVMPMLAKHHHVVAVDLRGAGFSDCPLTGYDKATLANDIHNTMQALGHKTYAVCGHDIGAMVAMALASLHRDAVTRLIVLDAPLPGWSGWEASLASLWQFSFHQKRNLPELLIEGAGTSWPHPGCHGMVQGVSNRSSERPALERGTARDPCARAWW